MDRTALGQAVAHTPTGLAAGNGGTKGAPAKKPLPKGRPVPLRHANPPSTPRGSGARLFLLMLLVFVSGGLFAAGLFWFLSMREQAQPAEAAVVAKGPEPKEQTAPVKTEHPPKQQEKAAPQLDPAKEKGLPAVVPEKKPAKVPEPEKEPAKSAKKPALSEDDIPPPVKPAPKVKPPVEKPAPKPEAPPPAPKPQPASEAAPLIAKLRTGTDEEKVKAAEQLAAKGEKAREAARALCEACVSPSKEVSRSALQALEKVAPELYEPVFTLVVDEQASNHRKAITTLETKGTEAAAAIPVMLHQLEKCQKDLKAQVEGFGRGGWGSQTLVQVITEHMIALRSIAPEDSEILKTIIKQGRTTFSRPVFQKLNGGLTATPFQSTGVGLVSELAWHMPKHRKMIIPELVALLEESVGKMNNDQPHFLLYHLADVMFIGHALLNCGAEAKDTLKKKVLPTLKELEFHKDATVRSVAKGLRKRVESGSVNADGELVFVGTLSQGRNRRFPCSMKAGKTYVVQVNCEGVHPALRLINKSGQVAAEKLAQGQETSRVEYHCTESGLYEVSLGTDARFGFGDVMGKFALHIREQ